ncbi:unnamed protein product [Fraxinus pennsylvanica]|uniref:Uncharacterized protein n=1 Tax=Fraxinus pennsylvanica TaxID=56036 RepID=A0AAD2EDV3_9LAMI|nr:unnamed protein product [Fraxinus pennsylvanica]
MAGDPRLLTPGLPRRGWPGAVGYEEIGASRMSEERFKDSGRLDDATCCKERVVLVAVYVARPRRRLPSSNYHNQQHFPQANCAAGGRRYNMRAELLDYARDLRTSARPGGSSPVHLSSQIIQPRAVQITPAQRKIRKTTVPTCLGNWKLLLPRFLTSIPASKTLKMKKKNKNKTAYPQLLRRQL